MEYSTSAPVTLLEGATCGRQRLAGPAPRRYFRAALVRFAVLVAWDTVFAAVLVADEAVRDAVRVADLTAPLSVFRIDDAGGLRLMPCAFNNAFTASDNSFTRAERRSTSADV
jgi:hypothetical protein